MKKKLLAVALAATMVISSAITAMAAEYSLAADTVNEFDNPLKGTSPTEVKVEFNITLADDAAANGWDSVLSIYDTATKGRISFQTNPYVCYNSDGNGGNTSFLDYNQPNENGVGEAVIGGLKDGAAHVFVYTITKDGITMTVDGNTVNGAVNGGEASYQEIIDFANTADKVYIGVGNTTVSSFWWTEICTLSDVKINGTEVGTSAGGNNGGNNSDNSDKNTSSGDDKTNNTVGNDNSNNNTAGNDNSNNNTAGGNSNTTTNGTTAPAAGDPATTAAVLVVMIAAAGAVIVLKRKKVSE